MTYSDAALPISTPEDPSCDVSVRMLTQEELVSPSESSHFGCPQVYHVNNKHDKEPVFHDPRLLHLNSPLDKVREVVSELWDKYTKGKYPSVAEPVDNPFSFMKHLCRDLAGVLTGQQCCICFESCDIGKETRLSMGPCGKPQCDTEFENPEFFGLCPTMDEHKAALDDMAMDFLISAFVAHLAIPWQYTEVCRRLRTGEAYTEKGRYIRPGRVCDQDVWWWFYCLTSDERVPPIERKHIMTWFNKSVPFWSPRQDRKA